MLYARRGAARQYRSPAHRPTTMPQLGPGLPHVPDDPPNHRLKTITWLVTAGLAVVMVRTGCWAGSAAAERRDVAAAALPWTSCAAARPLPCPQRRCARTTVQ